MHPVGNRKELRAVAALLQPLRRLKPADVTGSWSWIFSQSGLGEQARHALLSLAEQFLSDVGPSRVCSIFLEHGSFNDIFPADIVRHTLGFLAPPGAHERKVIEWPATDLLSCVFSVCKEWSVIAWNLRYGSPTDRGERIFQMGVVFELERDVFEASLAVWWLRAGVTKIVLTGLIAPMSHLVKTCLGLVSQDGHAKVLVTSLTCHEEQLWEHLMFHSPVLGRLERVSSDGVEIGENTSAVILQNIIQWGLPVHTWDIAIRNVMDSALFLFLPKMMPLNLECIRLPKSVRLHRAI